MDGYDVTIGALLNAGNIDLDVQDKNQRTALIIGKYEPNKPYWIRNNFFNWKLKACEEGYVLTINELIAAGANLNIQNSDGQTALIIGMLIIKI